MSATLAPDDVADDEQPPPRRARRRLILIAALLLVLAVGATYLVAFSPVFGVRAVTVRGVPGPLAAQVRRAAAIDSGTPLVRLDTAAVASRVGRIAVISSARVDTSFPSTVVITVSERVAIGVVRQTATYVLVDRTGDQFRTVDVRPARLPLFVVPSGSDARTTGGAVATVAAALPRKLRAHIASIQALDPAAITLLLKSGRVVRWGSADRSGAKAQILPTLLRQPGTQFDVTDPDRPFRR